MRIRTVKPEFWSHPVMSKQDDATKLLAIGLLNYADDEGYFFADAPLIRAALRPFDDDSSIVRRSIETLAAIGYVEIVEHPTHGMIGHVVHFLDHQRVDRPKKSPIKGLFTDKCVRRSIDDESSLYGIRDQGIKGSRDDAAPELPLNAECGVTPERIYDEYPRKVARPEALKAIRKAAAVIDAEGPRDGFVNGMEFLLDATLRYSKVTSRWAKPDREFIPHPATWFNQARYDDDPQTWERTSRSGGETQPEPVRYAPA